MKNLLLLLIVILPIVLNAESVIDTSERALFNQMMENHGIDSTSVNFFKDWGVETDLKLPVVVEILNHPWTYPEYVAQAETLITERKPLRILDGFSTDLFGASPNPPDNDYEALFRDTVRRPKDIFNYVDVVFTNAEEQRLIAFRDLSREEMDKLRFLAASMWSESEDSERFKTWRTQQGIPEIDNLDLKALIPILKKVNYPALMQAGVILQTGLEAIRDLWPGMGFKMRRSIEKETHWGWFRIGSEGNDTYERRYAFALDPAGDDSYRSHWGADWKKPFYLLLDFAGDDFYENTDIAGLFSVIGGAGVNWDATGDDVYRGGDYTMSSFFGYQCSMDDAGDDIYRGGLYSLAAGTFGLSLLADCAGCDEYYLFEYGEGFGGTLGAGILADYQGHDLYFAGGKYLHVPLAPNDYRSMAQGFGFGMRPDWGGGIGILFENGGNDTYKGGVYSQAVAYWYALGIIIDRAGNDAYDAVYYPQGSGIHLAAGFLFDRQGDDHYYSKNGPGQGCGHDWAVGFLVDRAGDDIYSVPGGNGLGLSNSVGVFLDAAGDDRYERSCPSNYGMAAQSRSSGGLGLFLDTGGHDRYATPDDTTKAVDFWRDNHTWLNDTYGIGLDTLAVIPKPKAIEELAELAAADVDSTVAIDSLFAIASSWGVGSYTERVRKAQRYLLTRQSETAKYIYEHKLGSDDGLTWRAIIDFANKSDSLKQYYSLALHHPDSLWNKGMIALIAELEDSTYIDSLCVFLQQKRYTPTILGALGSMKNDRCTAILEEYADSPSERYRVIVARGLKYIGTPRAHAALLRMKDDPSFTVRTIVKLTKFE